MSAQRHFPNNGIFTFPIKDPVAGKMKRQTNIKGGANLLKNKRDRYRFLSILRRNLEQLLAMGFDPYSDNNLLITKIKGEPVESMEGHHPKNIDSTSDIHKDLSAKESKKQQIKTTLVERTKENEGMEIYKALELGLNIKKNTLSPNSYPKYKSHITRFQNWLQEKHKEMVGINAIDKKIVITYLILIIQTSSAKPRTKGNSTQCPAKPNCLSPYQHSALALPVQTVQFTQQSLKEIWKGSIVF
ncbi:hypothetical protein ACOCEA_06920 [Maribacter sp. CXY002]|uniref:hypothetical protein n=1 Tax=Maribacter luteocoastalis TaxID=3407671 RepID=UPI003B6851A3